MMPQRLENHADPKFLTVLLSAAFFALCLVRLTIPSAPYFDEVHYVPAVQALIADASWLNREHPILGKLIIGAGITCFGDAPFGWRIFSAVFGTLALFASMRALWFASHSRFASLAFGILLATGFMLFVHARIAMLDVFMVAFFMTALWQCAAALREPETGRARLIMAGIALGLALGTKWNVVFLAMLPGITFFACRLTAGRRRLFTSQRGIPVPGISLFEAALWLGVLPLAVYWLTFLPAYFAPDNPWELGGFLALHQSIIDLQASVKQPHPYQSIWTDWMLNIRAIWYLYEPVDGAQRGVLLIGNPVTMVLGLAALALAAWRWVRSGEALWLAPPLADTFGVFLARSQPRGQLAVGEGARPA